MSSIYSTLAAETHSNSLKRSSVKSEDFTSKKLDVDGAANAYPVVRLYCQEQRGDHGDSFLPGDAACLILTFQQFVNLCQDGQLPELSSGEAHVPRQLVGVPWQRLWGLQSLSSDLQPIPISAS